MIFNAVWPAILLCLENSFWHVQQGSSAQDGFVKALNLYSTIKMDKHFISQETNDWFVIKKSPPKAGCTAFKNDILANRLCMSYLYLLWTYTLEISSPPWTSSLAFDSCLLQIIVCVMKYKYFPSFFCMSFCTCICFKFDMYTFYWIILYAGSLIIFPIKYRLYLNLHQKAYPWQVKP
jgi:hypothetical protein